MKLTTKGGRRVVAAAAFASAAILLPAVALASSAGSAAPKTVAATKTAAAPKTAATSRCARSQLTSWLGIPGNGTAGSTYYQLEISNISGRSCTLYGYPGVSAIRGGHQVGRAASRVASHPSTLLTLVPGSTVHVILQIVDVYNFPPNTCRPTTASALRVYAPGDYASMQFPFTFKACSKKAHVFMYVSASIGGTGIPGYSS
jgi:Protein of unknown function (DUF4232)